MRSCAANGLSKSYCFSLRKVRRITHKFESEFDTSSDVIVERLQELGAVRLVDRNKRGAKDIRYTITADGQELLGIVEQIQGLLEE